MNTKDISLKTKWLKSLEKKEKKIKKKDVESIMSPFIKREVVGNPYTIFAKNYAGREVQVVCLTREECLQNIATLNGFTLE